MSQRYWKPLAAEVAREGETHSVCGEHDGLDRPEYDDIFKGNTWGRAVDPAGVKAARQTEIEFIESAGVWEVVLRLSLAPGVPVIKGRWVDINKGDAVSKNYRSRYVAKEIRRGLKGSLIAEFFAAMQPLMCSKLLLALACTDGFPDENGVLRKPIKSPCVLFIDVKHTS